MMKKTGNNYMLYLPNIPNFYTIIYYSKLFNSYKYKTIRKDFNRKQHFGQI